MVKLIDEAGDKTIRDIFDSKLFNIPKIQRNFV